MERCRSGKTRSIFTGVYLNLAAKRLGDHLSFKQLLLLLPPSLLASVRNGKTHRGKLATHV